MADEPLILKTSLIPLTTLFVTNLSADEFIALLSEKRAAAPGLFDQLPCILSLSAYTESTLPLNRLCRICREQGVLPVGVSGLTTGWEQQIESEGLAIFSPVTKRSSPPSTEPPDPSVGETHAIPETLVHEGNVRSGQQLYSQSDLIIVGNVSAGAEVVAKGNIQIFGHLRGRALAGVANNEKALVSCYQFDAELVSIAGHYQVFDAPPAQQHNEPMIIQLKEKKLVYTSVR